MRRRPCWIFGNQRSVSRIGVRPTALERNVWSGAVHQTLRQATLIGFADDIAIVVIGKHLEDVAWACETSVRPIKDWLGVEVAEHKTEAILVSSRKLKEILRFHVVQHVIESKPFIIYLGAYLQGTLELHGWESTESCSWTTQTTEETFASQGAFIHFAVRSISLNKSA